MNIRITSRSVKFTTARHIELNNVPKSATPADIRRLLWRSKVQDIQDVSIIYKGFMPTGRALLTLNKPNFLRDNMRALENASISGIRVYSGVRMVDGDKQLAFGDGPHANTFNEGKNVLLWNLPRRTQFSTITPLLKGFALADCKEPIQKVKIDEFTFLSRFLIRLVDESEAHRLVRALHMTDLEPEKHGRAHPVRAHVVY
ncbi:hypothetical protein K435DRAFT_214985 [Dendrothele bispora CBS 962.96]|uniref:RRM domain-containing protein n=1 Tax=Dendrothele bispora (strain CBS 962.96) TaxID=1314807 RepID=A0A4S8LTA7_DENBC|nr:hypothetical protein K435DRAFT_214985 [Dendrothele bispora CBS 962.96]